MVPAKVESVVEHGVPVERVKFSAAQVGGLLLAIIGSAGGVYLGIRSDNRESAKVVQDKLDTNQKAIDERIAKIEALIDRENERAEEARTDLARQINALEKRVDENRFATEKTILTDRAQLQQMIASQVSEIRSSVETVRQQMASLQSQQATNVSRNELRLVLKSMAASNSGIGLKVDEFPF